MPRTTPDANDIIVQFLNDGPTTHANTGTSGSVDNWTEYGVSTSGATGLLDDAVYIPSTYLVNVRNGAGGSTDTTIGPNISMSGWVFLRRNTNYFGEVFNKQYFLNGWSSPFMTFGLQMDNTNDGRYQWYLTTGGVLHSVAPGTAFPMQQGRWSHVGGTWDGTTLNTYLNGNLVGSSPFTGTIDYGTAGNRGQWYVGGIPGSGTNQDAPVIVQDIRIANIARPQSYFANIYYNGFI